ncbi:restriction endonuclease [Acinetobacter baumannii]|uniref:restriction endonuclease n=1 Tax=Acinetobacter baumannii TaxID=470 RepID=UPI000D379BD9|nr:restriction endonuclease [Acinetobacter baumannii]PUV06817.1 restriction endonuclease [Acinetobacter baumannii]HEI9749459.1 restriction endonuclease [Acinetobacter baumannii]
MQKLSPDNSNHNYKFMADISENEMSRQLPEILDILLIDRTLSTPRSKKNIIWANENYNSYGQNYDPSAQIKPELITGEKGGIIKPRALKTHELQKLRTKSKAEVFTPLWVVKKQNDAVEQNYLNDDIETYVKRKWLEIACGEAPYMATRYDMETGREISLHERVGFVDRKLQRINREIDDKAEWQRLVEEAYKSSYGFEWNGDSLLLARENLLYTYKDYYFSKWGYEPTLGLLKNVAEIISYNIFQMDGLKYIVPLSEKFELIKQLNLPLGGEQEEWIKHPGKRVKIMNWDKQKMEFFDKGVK